VKAIVNVYPKFYSVPDIDSEHFQTFCWSELLLYTHFQNIARDIGLTEDAIISNWHELNSSGYIVWHVRRNIETTPESEHEDDSNTEASFNNIETEEWEFLSRIGHTNSTDLNDIQMLGRR
jgi:hypothetical protein